ncbi:Bul1 N terminus-domain-containing protein [Scheffersomyces xylosifermentans]|uniref:Bul1 N terminus-domain-containing protein n=1 Tax=Scheffersomyces xylosifermentans TaxID=1304137 RepID=UPI00315DDCA3
MALAFLYQLWSILPSYHMYTNTVSKNLNVTADESIEPPAYQNSSSTPSIVSYASNDSPLTSIMSPPVARGSPSTSSSSTGSQSTIDGAFIVADENTHSWQETVLDNVHKLRNLTCTDNPLSNAVDISVHFTKDICKVGEEPEEINPSLFEYSQGDYINGYVLIKSSASRPIPFEMFYLLFEGTIIVTDLQTKEKNPLRIKKFLEMFDFSASFNDGHINRLITEFDNPFQCPDMVDPRDGTRLSFGLNKTILPNRVYKRFFTFKIPNNLLDSECNEHNLTEHVQLPPSMGLSRYADSTPRGVALEDHIKDFSMIDTSVAYGVLARFIGRKSKYDIENKLKKHDDTTLINSTGDEYIILKETCNYMRIVRKSNDMTENEKRMKFVESKLIHENLFNRIKQKIEMGEELLKSIENDEFDSSIDISKKLTDTELELAKLRQSYRQNSRDVKFPQTKVDDSYEIVFPMMKKSFTGTTKNIGTMKVSTPKKDYTIKYIPPPKFRSHPNKEGVEPSWQLDVPIDLSVSLPSLASSNDTKKLPEIKSVAVELVVSTIQSEKYAIPIELHHNMIFNKPTTVPMQRLTFIDNDNITNNIVKPTQELSTKLYQIIKKLGVENFKIEKQMIDDIKGICQLKEKNINLQVNDVKIESEGQSRDSKGIAGIPWARDLKTNAFTKKFNLKLNLESISLKGNEKAQNSSKAYDKFCLVPNFQSCYLARMYYLKVILVTSTNEHIKIKVPVVIQKS